MSLKGVLRRSQTIHARLCVFRYLFKHHCFSVYDECCFESPSQGAQRSLSQLLISPRTSVRGCCSRAGAVLEVASGRLSADHDQRGAINSLSHPPGGSAHPSRGGVRPRVAATARGAAARLGASCGRRNRFPLRAAGALRQRREEDLRGK